MESPDDETTTRLHRFDAVYSETYGLVLAYCRRRLPNLHDAEDATSEVFMVVWRRLDDVTPPRSRAAWVIGIARNIVLNQRRGNKRRGRLSTRLLHTSQFLTIDPSDASLSTEGVAAAYAAVSRLPPLDQEILMLASLEQLSYQEIADVIGKTSTAVRSRLYRARTKLRDDLGLHAAEQQLNNQPPGPLTVDRLTSRKREAINDRGPFRCF